MKLTVLIVDADAGSARLVAEALKTHRRVERILTAFKPEDARKMAGRADLILIDPLLPGMDGATLLRRILNDGLKPGFIVMSAAYSREMSVAFYDLGAICCLNKPLDIEYLLNLITQWNVNEGTRLGGRDTELECRISNLLFELGMSPISGYYFCCKALKWMLAQKDTRGRITKELYPYLADSTSQSAKRVERNIRYAIEQTWLIGDPEVLERYFGYSVGPNRSRPSNAAFLRTLAEHLRIGSGSKTPPKKDVHFKNQA